MGAAEGERFLNIPALLGGDLGQEATGTVGGADVDTVGADAEVEGVFHRLHGGEDRDFDEEIIEFGEDDGVVGDEARIACGGTGHFSKGFDEGVSIIESADAAAKSAVAMVEGDETTARGLEIVGVVGGGSARRAAGGEDISDDVAHEGEHFVLLIRSVMGLGVCHGGAVMLVVVVVEAEVKGGRGMGERADGDAVDAGLGDSADGGEVDAAACFEGESGAKVFAQGDGAAHIVGSEIVEEDEVEIAIEDAAELVEGVDFDFDEDGRVGERAGALGGGVDRCGPIVERQVSEVIVFDEHGVEEADAVAAATAATDGVFGEMAEGGDGFAGVEDGGAGVRDGVDILGGEGGDAGVGYVSYCI